MSVRNYLILAGLIGAAVWINLWADGVPKPGEVLGSVEYLKESRETLNLRQVMALPDSVFRTQEPCCNVGLSKHAVWFRFKEKNTTPDKKDFLVEIVNPSIEFLQLYQVSNQGIVLDSFTTGAGYKYWQRPDTSSRQAESRNFLFPLKIQPDSSVWCYVRAASEYPLSLRVLFFEREERLQHQQRYVDVMMTVFYAMSLFFLVLTAILIISIRQPFHWHYFMYVLLTALFIPSHLGLGFKYIWAKYPDAQFIIPMALNNLRLIFGIQFFRYYFDLPKNFPGFNRLVNWSTAVFSVTLLIQVIHRLFDRWLFTGWIFYPFFGLLILFSLFVLAWLVYAMLFRRRGKLTWVYVIVALNFLGVAITSQQYTGITWFQQLGVGWTDLDVADKVMTVCGMANTFFLSPLVIAAFFLEMVLVFGISTKRYLHLIEKDQRARLRLAKEREASLKALITGVENERKRIARELHDGACVNLAAINMKVDSLIEHLSEQPVLADKMGEIAADLEATFLEVRDISHDLMSKTLEKTGLRAALEELVLRSERVQPGLSITLIINFPLESTGNFANIHIYRIVQELLGNALKYAKAEEVNIQILDHQESLLLTVEDNGIGCDSKKMDNNGIGLSNVRHRVESLRGRLHIDTAPGKGFFVSISIDKKELR